ncbi:MAG: hypothetical protein JXK16_12505 [Thiotrichales bacterium]|nr:hypothetical protein [Thiotrichales bacterium]
MSDQSTDNQTIPTAEEMLARLQAVDVNQFDINAVVNEIKGNKQWISILTIPVATILLGLFTLIGVVMFDSLIVSFLISAGLLFFIGRILDQYEQQYRAKARREVTHRIAKIEQDFGLIPHFKHFLPTKYRHLWQSLRKGRYHYIDQYIQALVLLQHKLDHEKFTKIWNMTYPQLENPEPQQQDFA